MWASSDWADRCEVPDQVGRSRPMKTPMSEQAQLESYPRRYIQPVQHGANLVFDPAGARKQQNQTSCSPQDTRQRAEEALRRPTEESVAVVESRRNQCSNQGVWRIHSERPTDRPKLTDVEEARPCQPGDMIRETQNQCRHRDREPWRMVELERHWWWSGRRCIQPGGESSPARWTPFLMHLTWGGCWTSIGPWPRCNERDEWRAGPYHRQDSDRRVTRVVGHLHTRGWRTPAPPQYWKHPLYTGWRTMGRERNPEEHRTGQLLLRMLTHCIECIAFCRPGMSASSRAPFLQTQTIPPVDGEGCCGPRNRRQHSDRAYRGE